jgi:hypothetical protein
MVQALKEPLATVMHANVNKVSLGTVMALPKQSSGVARLAKKEISAHRSSLLRVSVF